MYLFKVLLHDSKHTNKRHGVKNSVSVQFCGAALCWLQCYNKRKADRRNSLSHPQLKSVQEHTCDA